MLGDLKHQGAVAKVKAPSSKTEKDLLELAERAELPIFAFDEAIRDFLRVGLLEEIFED